MAWPRGGSGLPEVAARAVTPRWRRIRRGQGLRRLSPWHAAMRLLLGSLASGAFGAGVWLVAVPHAPALERRAAPLLVGWEHSLEFAVGSWVESLLPAAPVTVGPPAADPVPAVGADTAQVVRTAPEALESLAPLNVGDGMLGPTNSLGESWFNNVSGGAVSGGAVSGAPEISSAPVSVQPAAGAAATPAAPLTAASQSVAAQPTAAQPPASQTPAPTISQPAAGQPATSPSAVSQPAATASLPSRPAPVSTARPAVPTPGGSGAPVAPGIVHVIKSGDTLSALANRYGTTVSAIVALNRLTDPDVLREDDRLIIPR